MTLLVRYFMCTFLTLFATTSEIEAERSIGGACDAESSAPVEKHFPVLRRVYPGHGVCDTSARETRMAFRWFREKGHTQTPALPIFVLSWLRLNKTQRKCVLVCINLLTAR